KPGESIPVTGYAQVGLSGLSKVQVWIQSNAEQRASEDRSFAGAPWIDAQILGPPKQWRALPNGKIPAGTIGFDSTVQPRTWPMRLTKVHWAVLLPGLPAGEYTLRSRTIDETGAAQPMPRPFRKSGFTEIEQVSISVKPAA